ncbi:hypothetical protein TNCT_241681 [Trichonephila clavata]|uniref:Uncharacterized protein n=1 Tax=Trichonephila clavata TaxID=2740835 RepID=A0A8X6LWG9_TRICU|nr:hypothetical protein TNCT_241681 [Trichonephila clavata]
MLKNMTFQDAQREKSFRLFSIGLLYKAVSTSATFVFTMVAQSDRFLSATDPVSRNRCTTRVIADAFSAVLRGYVSAKKHLSLSNEL